ncbi:MAG: hypothetical protein AB7K24_10995, partial [Gemmataceae bacterium]
MRNHPGRYHVRMATAGSTPWYVEKPGELSRAMLEALAVLLCIVATEALHLNYGYLGVISVH